MLLWIVKKVRTVAEVIYLGCEAFVVGYEDEQRNPLPWEHEP